LFVSPVIERDFNPAFIIGTAAPTGLIDDTDLTSCVVPLTVTIVGGGPAGSAAAISLTRAGHRVTIIDKATFPRDKCCGDGLTTGALRILDDLGFDRSRVTDWQPCHEIEIRTPSGRSVSLDLPSSTGLFAAIAPRQQLDKALLDQARDAGAVVHEGTTFTSVDRNDDRVHISCVDAQGEAATFESDYLIAADGMWSPVRKHLGVGIDGYLGEWHAFRQYVSNVTGDARTKLIVWFEPDLLPGYAWSFPLPGNRANIGFGVLRDAGHSVQFMKNAWDDLKRRKHVLAALGTDAVFEDRHTAWPIPARVDDATKAIGRVLFIGDAVCATDSLTGEGIGQALLTGQVAAVAIGSHGDDAASVRSAYEKSMSHHFYADHRMSKLLGKVLAHRRGAEGALRVVNVNSWTRRNFVRWMFEDEPRAALFTPSRWHRGFLKRPGAFVD
jgi:geranylgeranyl reductase family protein